MGLETYPLRVVLRVDGEDTPTELPVLLPHEVYHAMHEKSVVDFVREERAALPPERGWGRGPRRLVVILGAGAHGAVGG